MAATANWVAGRTAAVEKAFLIHGRGWKKGRTDYGEGQGVVISRGDGEEGDGQRRRRAPASLGFVVCSRRTEEWRVEKMKLGLR